MRYPELRYVPESQDPSIELETRDLVIKVIDNTGLLCDFLAPHEGAYIGRKHQVVPISHHLGYHGVRTLYDKQERRNIVAPFVSWLNLQGFSLTGPDGQAIPLDPIDEQARRGIGRGWPVAMGAEGAEVVLRIGPMPRSGLAYTMTIRAYEPDGIEYRVEFLLTRDLGGPVTLSASWPCYMNTFYEVELHYPQGASNPSLDSESPWKWNTMGQRKGWILGETVGFDWSQEGYDPEDLAAPMAFGRVGHRALLFSFEDPEVVPFVANGGAHFQFSTVENPAWDFRRIWRDVMLESPVGFRGRIEYFKFRGEEEMVERYRAFRCSLS